MRICQIIESSSGGSVQVALAIAQGLADKGDAVTFLYSPIRTDQAFLDQKEKITKVSFMPLEMQRSVGLHDLSSLFRLWKILKKKGPFDLIHAHSSKAGGLLRLLRLLLPRQTALVYTPHAFVTMAPGSGKAYRWIERALSFGCDAIIAVSSGEKEHAVGTLHIAPSRVKVILNGIDVGSFPSRKTARDLLGLDDGRFVVGFVGRFVPQKNMKRLLETFAAAKRQEPTLHLVLVGGGEELPTVRERLHDLALQDDVTLLLDQSARPIIPAFDALLCASDYEGISLVFLEALAAGVPLVTTPVAGAHETVLEGQTGFIASDFTVDSLSACLLRVVRMSPDDRTALSVQAKAHSALFSLERMVAAHRDLYGALIAARRQT